jgi:hypothetical protein
VLGVNADALVERNGRTVAFVVRDNVAREVALTRGAKLGDFVAVTGDVKVGDKLVQKPGDAIHDGIAVKIEAK